MTRPPEVTVSHIGICVSDQQRSIRFYTEALGFERGRDVAFKEPFDTLTELPGLDGRGAFVEKGAIALELLTFDNPPPVGPGTRRPMNRRGMTHLSLVVDDLEATARLIVEHGGQALRDTLVDGGWGPMMFATDPDGVRLELWEKAP